MECPATTTGSPSKSASRFPCFFFGFRRGTASWSSPDSSAATASDSLRNTIFPSTSIKEIWSSVSCLSDDLPKRCLFKSAVCSNTSWSVRSVFSSCSCCDRNSRMRVSLSRLFSFSSVYLKSMPPPPGIQVVLLYQKTADFANLASSCIRHNAHASSGGYGLFAHCFFLRSQNGTDVCAVCQNCLRNAQPWRYTAGMPQPERQAAQPENFSVLHKFIPYILAAPLA